MGMQNDTSSEVEVTEMVSGGYQVGQSVTDLIGFYGKAPQKQISLAAQAAVVDGSVGAASATSGIQPLTSSYNSGIIANSIATLAAQTNAMRNALVSLGIIKGS